MADIPTSNGEPDGQQIVNDRKLFVHLPPWGFELEFGLFARNPIDKAPLKAKVVFERYEMTSYGSEPTFTLDKDAATILMDQLWERGIRPTNIINVDSRIEAVNKHLEDMRRIAFKFLDGEK